MDGASAGSTSGRVNLDVTDLTMRDTSSLVTTTARIEGNLDTANSTLDATGDLSVQGTSTLSSSTFETTGNGTYVGNVTGITNATIDADTSLTFGGSITGTSGNIISTGNVTVSSGATLGAVNLSGANITVTTGGLDIGSGNTTASGRIDVDAGGATINGGTMRANSSSGVTTDFTGGLTYGANGGNFFCSHVTNIQGDLTAPQGGLMNTSRGINVQTGNTYHNVNLNNFSLTSRKRVQL